MHPSRILRYLPALMVLLLVGVLGCQGSYQERYSKVRSACRAGNKQEAAQLMGSLRSDKKFERIFVAVLNKVGVSKTDYCDPLLIIEVEKALNRPPEGQR